MPTVSEFVIVEAFDFRISALPLGHFVRLPQCIRGRQSCCVFSKMFPLGKTHRTRKKDLSDVRQFAKDQVAAVDLLAGEGLQPFGAEAFYGK